MSKLTILALAPASAPTGSATGSAIDVSDFTGNGYIVLDCGAPAAAETLDVKLQHCDTAGGSYVDAGTDYTFTQVTNAGGASYQVKQVSLDGLKKYVKAVTTKVGTTALARGVYMVGNKAL